MKAIKDYHDMYLKNDVLLLAYVFEKHLNVLWIISKLLVEWTRFRLGCNAQNDKI